MQKTWVRSLSWEDHTCLKAMKPLHHNYWDCSRALQLQLLSLCAETTEAFIHRVCTLQQEKPLLWEACRLKLQSSPHSQQLEQNPCNSENSAQPKINKNKNFFSFIFISWRLITLQYCSGFCHTLTWISHGFTCVPHPDPPSHLPPHPIPLGLPSAPAPGTCLMHPTWAGDLFHPW